MNHAVMINPEWANGDTAAPCLVDTSLPRPTPGPRDLLVDVAATAINPIDFRMMRARLPRDNIRIIGWDAAGTVVDVGQDVQNFSIGDTVFYAGTLLRHGAQQQFQAVDERIVGRKPETISFAQAAALPMASLASWQALFESLHLNIQPETNAKPGDILIWGAGGGVGTMATQLAAKIAGCRVIASASRPVTAMHCKAHGASMIVDHSQPLAPQLEALGITQVPRILCLSDPADLIDMFARIISPGGMICCLADSKKPVAINTLRNKSASFSWQGVFTRSLFDSPDMAVQSDILNHVASLVDQGILNTPLTVTRHGITARDMMDHYTWFKNNRPAGKVSIMRQNP